MSLASKLSLPRWARTPLTILAGVLALVGLEWAHVTIAGITTESQAIAILQEVLRGCKGAPSNLRCIYDNLKERLPKDVNVGWDSGTAISIYRHGWRGFSFSVWDTRAFGKPLTPEMQAARRTWIALDSASKLLELVTSRFGRTRKSAEDYQERLGRRAQGTNPTYTEVSVTPEGDVVVKTQDHVRGWKFILASDPKIPLGTCIDLETNQNIDVRKEVERLKQMDHWPVGASEKN